MSDKSILRGGFMALVLVCTVAQQPEALILTLAMWIPCEFLP